MKSKFSKTITIILATIFGFNLIGTNLTPAVFATDVCSQDENSVPAEVWEASGCKDNSTNNALPNIIANILSVIVAISGTIAVIFIVIGGINYITSSGDSNKVEKAKKTILYALIGLVISALAFAITQFTINAINNSSSTNQNQNNNNTPIKT